ncbi:MAG: hypothetical protein L0L51_07835 [Lactococcus lactis]|nr:hypothetical protein [Lactococcus lactis]
MAKMNLTKIEKRALETVEWFPDEKHLDIEEMINNNEVEEITPNYFSGAENPDNPESQKEVLRAISIDISENKELRDMLKGTLNLEEEVTKDKLLLAYTLLEKVYVISEGEYQGVYVENA